MPYIRTKAVDLAADADNVTTDVTDGGSITGYASTWTREPDFYGDVVAKGAFAASIERIEAEGRTLPLLWNHDAGDLKSYIGTVTGLAEDDHGLLFTATFDATPEAQRARELAMDGRLAKFSFAYDVIDQMEVELDGGRKANELRELDIHEVSLVLYPANPDTSVVEVKGADTQVEITEQLGSASRTVTVKAGRRNSKADEDAIRQAIALLQGVLGDEPEDGDDAPEPEGEGVKAIDANETDQPTEGGEGDASPEGRDVEKARLDAYKRAILRAN